MKALSIQQPWAYCITHGTKRVENRTRYTGHRGPLLIHAGKTYQRNMEYAIHADSPEVDVVGMKRSARGALVGVCDLVACIRKSDVVPDQRIWAGDEWCYALDNVRAFAAPVPYIGMLGLFEVPDAVVADALRALRAA